MNGFGVSRSNVLPQLDGAPKRSVGRYQKHRIGLFGGRTGSPSCDLLSARRDASGEALSLDPLDIGARLPRKPFLSIRQELVEGAGDRKDLSHFSNRR